MVPPTIQYPSVEIPNVQIWPDNHTRVYSVNIHWPSRQKGTNEMLASYCVPDRVPRPGLRLLE